MVMKTLLFFAIFLGPNTDVLVTSQNCSPCKKATVIIKRLQNDDYDVEIISLQAAKRFKITTVPTLVVRSNGSVDFKIVGLQSEWKYRTFISKTYSPRGKEFTGAINFTNNEHTTLVYVGIVRRAKRNPFGYLEYNPDNRPDLVQKYNITRLPTLLLLKSGVEIGRYIGITPYND